MVEREISTENKDTNKSWSLGSLAVESHNSVFPPKADQEVDSRIDIPGALCGLLIVIERVAKAIL